MANRKVKVDITPHCGVYVTIIMRAEDCTENEKAVILENAKKFYETANEYGGEKYDLPVHTPIDLGEVVFHNTFVFPNSELTQRYVETISNIQW